MKLKIEKIIIFVRDVDRLKAFYVDILNLALIEEVKSEWVLLKAGHCQVGLHKTGDQYMNAHEEFKFHNNTKIVFEIDESIFEAREDLKKRNVPIKEIVTWDNYDFWICDGTDPEGNVFQLKQSKNQPVH